MGQILPMEVVYKCQFGRLLIRGVPLNCGDGVDSHALGRTPSPLPTDQLECIADATYDHGLQLTVALHRAGELGNSFRSRNNYSPPARRRRSHLHTSELMTATA